MDDWDQAFLDALSARPEVIIFDNAGVGATTGHVPGAVGGMAEDAAEFIRGLALSQIDLLGWSMGGAVAQSWRFATRR